MDYSGIKALVMGLGLHGGGLQSARFLLGKGADVTVTDLRDEKILQPSIEQLDTACREMGRAPVRYVLGKHEIEDFQKADVVVKNPGVKPDSPFLKAAKRIETDISLFLQESPARLFAVTGSKGKSSTSAALHWILNKTKKSGKAFLGGNITVSPLTFLNGLNENDDVVLELSSFQLGDLKDLSASGGCPLLKPKAAIITAIMPDHLDRYASMEEYVDDKRNIYRGQDSSCFTIAGDCAWGKSFLAETKGRPLVYSNATLGKELFGGWIDGEGRGMALLEEGGECAQISPERPLCPGEHQKLNLLAAALAAYSLGADAKEICGALSDFPGIEHRLEFFHEAGGVRFYNDSAATIPQAAAACIEAFSAQAPLVLVTGGSDKNLDLSTLAKAVKNVKKVILLAGSGSEKLIPLLKSAGVSYSGPFDELEKAVVRVLETVEQGDIAVLSPGCTSFGMFLNEFDRGKKWKEAVLRETIRANPRSIPS